MGLIVGRGDESFVECDNPLVRGCVAKTEPLRGQNEAAEVARLQGWYKNETDGKWTCPSCLTENHDVLADHVGFNPRPRLTCYSSSCRLATLVAQPYMTQVIWDEKSTQFLSAHPCKNIRTERSV